MQPYTDKTLESLPKEGKKNILIICPGFASDCLETLEEVSVEFSDVFKQAGGEVFHYIPALNDSEPGIKLLSNLLEQACA